MKRQPGLQKQEVQMRRKHEAGVTREKHRLTERDWERSTGLNIQGLINKWNAGDHTEGGWDKRQEVESHNKTHEDGISKIKQRFPFIHVRL